MRDRLRRQRLRLRGHARIVPAQSGDTSESLQDQVVTDRNGRFVLVVRADFWLGNPGHHPWVRSSSGASLFLEPLGPVEINNEVVALEQQEADEIRRILLQLTDQFRRRALDLQRTIETGTDLDIIQAKARFSAIINGVEPVIGNDGAFELLAARHPLLMPDVSSRLADIDAARAGRGPAGTGDATAPANETNRSPSISG